MSPLPSTGSDVPPIDIASRVLGETVLAADAITTGGNNRVYRITTARHTCAMKLYPLQAADPRDRLDQEFRAMSFLNENGVDGVPQALVRDDESRCAIYEWIDGQPVKQGPAAGDREIDAMLNLMQSISGLTSAPGADTLADASASCFSAAAVLTQFEDRLARLKPHADDAPALKAMMEERILPLFPKLAERATVLYENAGLRLDQDIDPAESTLSPSDFGFHNMLRRGDGLVFVDFEYFGWDDPVKMVSDVLWHPGSDLDESLAGRFRDHALQLFTDRDGERFAIRFEALFPLFGMIWCLITLNEFLPERWERRAAAGGLADMAAAQQRQLEKADRLLSRIEAVRDTSYA